MCEPSDLYLRKNKLWFIRRRDVEFLAAKPPAYFRTPAHLRDPSPEPVEMYFHISYFDLNEENPVEHIVGRIEDTSIFVGSEKIEMPRNLQWVKDVLIFQQTENELTVFNLDDLNWSTPFKIRFDLRLNSFIFDICRLPIGDNTSEWRLLQMTYNGKE